MADELNARKIAFRVADDGIERVEPTGSWEAVEGAGGAPGPLALVADPGALRVDGDASRGLGARDPDGLAALRSRIVEGAHEGRRRGVVGS